MDAIKLKERQKKILEIIKTEQPISGENIARKLSVSRSALRTDLSVLSMAGLIGAKPKVGYYTQSPKKHESEEHFLEEWLEPVGNLKGLPVVLDEKASVYDAIVTLFLEDVGTIFIVAKECLVGVVSRKDFLKTALGSSDLKNLPVGMIMTRMPNVVFVYPEDSLLYAAQKIIEHEIDCLPVVEPLGQIEKEEGYRVIGKISKTNITNQFAEIFAKAQGGTYDGAL